MSKKRVAVAMSGGVDSSLVTARLQAQGYDVIGVTMLLFDTVENNKVVESATITDAKRVADQLAVPHYVLDLRQSFEEKIMQYFTQSYACGITPNPCVMCNDWIKFGSLYEFSRDLDADFLATGHYARVLYNQESNLYELRRGTDLKKDQSYVLYHLNQKMLPHIMFPLGEMHKEDTRALAKELNLPVYNKPESQDICFIPDNDHIRFLKERIPEQFVPGDIVDLEGSILGTHQGLLYTWSLSMRNITVSLSALMRPFSNGKYGRWIRHLRNGKLAQSRLPRKLKSATRHRQQTVLYIR